MPKTNEELKVSVKNSKSLPSITLLCSVFAFIAGIIFILHLANTFISPTIDNEINLIPVFKNLSTNIRHAMENEYIGPVSSFIKDIFLSACNFFGVSNDSLNN